MSKLLVTNEIGLAEVLASSPGKQCRTTNRSLNMKSREEIFKRGRIKMEFRKLTEQDLPSLLELYKQLQPDDEASSEKKSKTVWQEIENNPDIHYFGAIDNGKVVSTCFAVYIPNLTRNSRGFCFVENVVTDKDYRNQGLASRVIDMAISYAKEKDCYKVILQSGIARAEAHRFYENKGFDGSSKKAFDLRLG